MVNISDVARAAGVSKATVSYVLSNDPRITEQTAKKVRKAVDDLGYTVNHAARALSAKETKTFGIVSPAVHGTYLSALFGLHVYLLSEHAARYGYDTLFIGSDDGAEAMRKAWASRKVDGFILMDVCDDDPRMRIAAKMGMPTVAFGSPKDSFGLDMVDSDFVKEAKSIIEFLVAEGHRETILVLWSQLIFKRRMGFALRFYDAIMESARNNDMTVHVVSPDDDDSDPSRIIEQSLESYPNTTAMVLHNEPATIVAPQTFAQKGITVPDDLRVITVFPKQLGTPMKIPFASVQTDVGELTKAVIQLLMSRVANRDAPMEKLFFDFPLVAE
ncbi:LacI family transcriptional regulator [Bifidobacterium longum]|mgnify:CR=1 FL=1|jgi:DNA-binding LacI/PurR family transcriptional regulator|uniref:LacI family transcriptional regulator n=2 Tax=Bifidobacterium longum TaxID=216816 RepID=A0A7U4KEB0_BIFLN|nr:LacI family DNA-binding transcriptional regulator [Bifidobacterium longum]ADH00770.1 regulatory protein, LacI [Bifidobacterium longum subsp. longum JDM301]AIF90835.1 LacI family transcriptional regulator [Bifidobacterium longum]